MITRKRSSGTKLRTVHISTGSCAVMASCHTVALFSNNRLTQLTSVGFIASSSALSRSPLHRVFTAAFHIGSSTHRVFTRVLWLLSRQSIDSVVSIGTCADESSSLSTMRVSLSPHTWPSAFLGMNVHTHRFSIALVARHGCISASCTSRASYS